MGSPFYQLIENSLFGQQFHYLPGERVGEQNNHGNNKNVDCQGLDHGQTDHHGGQDLATCAGIAGNTFNRTFDSEAWPIPVPKEPSPMPIPAAIILQAKNSMFFSFYDCGLLFLNSLGLIRRGENELVSLFKCPSNIDHCQQHKNKCLNECDQDSHQHHGNRQQERDEEEEDHQHDFVAIHIAEQT